MRGNKKKQHFIKRHGQQHYDEKKTSKVIRGFLDHLILPKRDEDDDMSEGEFVLICSIYILYYYLSFVIIKKIARGFYV